MNRVLRHGALLALALALAACGDGAKTYQGWVEADLVFVGPDEAGRVQTLSVEQGAAVDKGAALFTVDEQLQQADVVSAEAALTNAQQVFDRAQHLLKSNAGTQKEYDASQAGLRDAEAKLNAARTRLARRSLVSPVTGSVEQIYYRVGEVVPAGKPIVALLPPGNLKIRFYVPQAVLPRLKVGTVVNVACDGCAAGLTARVNFLARSAEYTPPVIYSREERGKLVFLVEARPEDAAKFRVGQPVDVSLPGEAGR